MNAKDNGGRTALMAASNYGHTEIVSMQSEQNEDRVNAAGDGS